MIDSLSWEVSTEVKSGLPNPLILVVDEDIAIRRYLRTALISRGYRVVELDNPNTTLTALQRYRPNLLILDPQFMNDNGIILIADIRKTWRLMPILVVSEQKDTEFMVSAMDVGADDYVLKPFGIEELAARIRVALRHVEPPNIVWSMGDLLVDMSRQIVRKNGQFVRLTPIEYELLKKLIANAGKSMSSRELSNLVWGNDTPEHVRRLRVHMSNLRTKLEMDPAHPELILTAPGFGYQLFTPE